MVRCSITSHSSTFIRKASIFKGYTWKQKSFAAVTRQLMILRRSACLHEIVTLIYLETRWKPCVATSLSFNLHHLVFASSCINSFYCSYIHLSDHISLILYLWYYLCDIISWSYPSNIISLILSLASPFVIVAPCFFSSDSCFRVSFSCLSVPSFYSSVSLICIALFSLSLLPSTIVKFFHHSLYFSCTFLGVFFSSSRGDPYLKRVATTRAWYRPVASHHCTLLTRSDEQRLQHKDRGAQGFTAVYSLYMSLCWTLCH